MIRGEGNANAPQGVPLNILPSTHLQVGAVDVELGAEEALDDGHDGLRDVLLQHGVGVLAVRGAVAHL